MRRHFTEALWVIGGQAVTALGTLVGVRVLTQFLDPATYGVVTLSLGICALAISIAAAPLTQAAIHFYPSVVASGSVHALLDSLLRCFRSMLPWAALVLCCAAGWYVIWGREPVALLLLLILLLTSDCWRASNLSLLNAARRQQRFATWMAADAWLRPLGGALAVLAFGRSPTVVIAAYVAVSFVLLVAFSRKLWPLPDGPSSYAEPTQGLDARMWSYALPLVPLGVIAWVSNLGDRYIIGGVLGVADAGIYAAVYGLSCLPFLIVQGTAEQALRPMYQSAVTSGDQSQSRRILVLWLAITTGVCALGVIGLIFLHGVLAAVLVGKAYRGAADLMPWIGAGYAIRAISYVFERVCYAYGRTRRVLAIQLYAVAATAIATPIGVLKLGLRGAALAVPVYFSVQLIVAVFLARRTIRESGSVHSDSAHAVHVATVAS